MIPISYKGIIIENSLRDKSVLNQIKTLNDKTEIQDGEVWHLRLVEVDEDNIDNTSKTLQELLKESWYIHFFNDRLLVVIFNDKIFKLDVNDPDSWLEAVKHGISQGILEEQLDFWPHDDAQTKEWLENKDKD